MCLLTETYENLLEIFLLRRRNISHLPLDNADVGHGMSLRCEFVGWSIKNELRVRRSARRRHCHWNSLPNLLRGSMTWSIHTSLSISRLCSDNVANDPNQLGNADVGTIHTFLFWYQFVKLQFGIWLQFAANLYKLLTARRAVSTNLLQISSIPESEYPSDSMV